MQGRRSKSIDNCCMDAAFCRREQGLACLACVMICFLTRGISLVPLQRYLYDEMPFFQPRKDGRNAIYMGAPEEQKGIQYVQCFGDCAQREKSESPHNSRQTIIPAVALV